jgi:hypothetical protein
LLKSGGGIEVKRYFEIFGKRQVAELIIADGSPAAKAKETAFNSFFKAEVREISRQEYLNLKKLYSV